MRQQIYKYPRTQHIEGSRLQPGDEDMDNVPFADVKGRYVVIEEKMDGANSAVSFTEDGQLQLQSRGHYLTGGPREKHFNLFKQWANCHALRLWQTLGSRYVMYGEWVFAKHTIFYDELPHYFLEFDLYDVETGIFLDTKQRHRLLKDTPVVSVPVLRQGEADNLDAWKALVQPALYKSDDWRERLDEVSQSLGLDAERIRQETDPTDLAEGLYIKVEEGGQVVDRYKFVRPSFLTQVLDSGSHWLQRPIVPNQLRADVDLFGTS